LGAFATHLALVTLADVILDVRVVGGHFFSLLVDHLEVVFAHGLREMVVGLFVDLS
jgi:hypothetical protein